MEKNEKNKKEEDSKEELTIEDIPGVGEATAEKLRGKQLYRRNGHSSCISIRSC